MQKNISINKDAVARAIREPLDAYYKEVAATSYDGSTARPGNWEENEVLCNALAKSPYVSQHLDWLYLVELIFVVLDHHPPLKAAQFADELEKLIIATASGRDYLAIFPLSFKPMMTFGLRGTSESVVKRKNIGQFTIFPGAATAKALNMITAWHGFPALDESDFQHAMRTSNKALARDMVVTFDVHGAEDQLRWNAEILVTHLRRLIEVFGVLFGEKRSSYVKVTPVNHFFLLNKSNGELRRLPTRAPSIVDLPLDKCLFQSLGRPVFNDFLAKLTISSDSMYGRMKNSIKFFSMALNADDAVSSFLFYVIAMESIFSRDKNNPIKVTLADLGAMLCFPPEQRLKAHERIRKAYDLRSSIVHSGVSFVPHKDVEVAKMLAARSIYASLFLCHQLETGEGKLEDRFFNHLRDQKLGLAKASAPKYLWELPEFRDEEHE